MVIVATGLVKDQRYLERFVYRFYESKDMMHDLTHIRRILASAIKISKKHKTADLKIVKFAAYLHGIDIDANNKRLTEYLRSKSLKTEAIKQVFRAARESQKESVPKTIEGKILHDAHLLEGGRTFHVVKSLVTGASRGNSLQQTMDHFNADIYGKYKCYLAENTKQYEEKEAFARKFFNDLAKNLGENP